MSMFDKEVQLKNATEFDAYSGCRIFTAEYLGIHEGAQYKNSKAKVLAGPIDSVQGAAKEYILYGTMAEQVSRLTAGDLPANVKITQDGQANVLVKL